MAATHIVKHRGPDDEGYLLWSPASGSQVFAGSETAPASRQQHRLAALPATADWQVALGHRRLSIVDLSPGGHQPMVHRATGIAVAYNGEIYNHIELKRELQALGHAFESDSDTEVLLASWAEWGPASLNRLNGMFAFVLLDPRGGGTLHVIRDRFGVKPLYVARTAEFLAFASECKQIRALPGFSFRLDESTALDYLAHGMVDHTRHTFDARIQQVMGGEHCTVTLSDGATHVRTSRWYEPRIEEWHASDADAAARFRELLTDSVRLRLRADVPVGSCLSGGLDSSSIVCLARNVLVEQQAYQPQVTVTARFEDERYDEWRFASLVIETAKASAIQVWPSQEKLAADLDRMLWHLDEPFGSTSQFSQWCVFERAAAAGLTVMLDGQGSDEQLAGYEGSTRTALLTGLLRRGEVGSLVAELVAAPRGQRRMAVAQAVLAMRNIFPSLDRVLPAHVRARSGPPDWLRLEAPSRLDLSPPCDLGGSLHRQTFATSLPALLRYEDRSSMAWSIEARVPFLDYRLVEFVAGLRDRLKLHRGRSKVVLREALEGVLPEPVRQRRDKMGFVTPEEAWLRDSAQRWFRDQVDAAVQAAPELFDFDRARHVVSNIVAARAPFSFAPWRILCFGRWLAAMAGGSMTQPANHAGAVG